MVELEDHVQTAVTATVHDGLILTCRLGEHITADEQQVTWYRDRCVIGQTPFCCGFVVQQAVAVGFVVDLIE